MRSVIVRLGLTSVAAYGAFLSWQIFATDALYGQIAIRGSGSLTNYISENSTYPYGDVRFEILEQNAPLLLSIDKRENLRTIRKLRLAEFKEPINIVQINNLIRHESLGFRTGYDIGVLVNYGLTMSQSSFGYFGDAVDLALKRYYELPSGVRNRAIHLCNLRYSKLPSSYRARMIHSIVVNNVARDFYENSFDKNLISDLYQYL